jgi:hypothetical protein
MKMAQRSNDRQNKGVVCDVIAQAKNGKFVRVEPTGTGFECKGTIVGQPVKS